MKNIGYHTRLYNNNAQKVVGGSFSGSMDMETVERLVNAHFEVVVKTSGTPVFVDHSGREVTLYVSVEARNTKKGEQALKKWREERAKQESIAQAQREREEEEISELMEGLSHEELVRRLKGTS